MIADTHRIALALAVCAPLLAACSTPGPAAATPDASVDAGASTWTTAFDASKVGWLLNTCGPRPDDLYMVGGSVTKAAAMHYDGTSWQPISLGVDVPLLNWCHGFAANDVTIVGTSGTIVHFDGTSWTKQAAPTTEDLWGVWGTAHDDLWAVGGSGLEAGRATLLHYDGTAWSTVALPALQKPNVHQLLKVWGTDARNAYAVGQGGVVLHFDGSAWKEELVGASDDLVSLWGTGPDRVVAVGGRSNAIVSVWDGTSWHTRSLSPLPGLNGIWMRAPGKAHVAGAYGTLGVLDLATFQVQTADLNLLHQDFHSVYGDASGRLWAVGGNLASANPSQFVGLAYGRSLGAEE